MPNKIEWSDIRLGDVCAKIGSGATPRGGSDVYLKSGEIALIRSQNVYNNGFFDTGLAYIEQRHADELSNVTVSAGDVLLNITGDSVARCCQVPRWILQARVNQHVAIIRPDPNRLDAGFLRYTLINPSMQEHLYALASAGATRSALTKGMIESLQIKVPPIEFQRAIARALGSLDDKIEENQRINETLEATARVVFQSWFIDFDAIRAKAEGRQPLGMDSEMAALFPNDFDESQESTPTGWRRGKLGDVLTTIETGTRPKGGVKHITEGMPSVGAESIVGIGHFDYNKTKYVPSEFYQSMSRGRVLDGDVLLYKDGGRPGEFEPHVTMVGDGFPFTEFCINEHVYRLRTDPTLPQSYLYLWLTSDAVMQEMRNRGTGVAIPGLNSSAVREVAVLIPNKDVLESFDRLISPLIHCIFNNCNESRTLATMRDALLPKLLSGEFTVGDADKLLSHAA